jgi:hypothetical protein
MNPLLLFPSAAPHKVTRCLPYYLTHTYFSMYLRYLSRSSLYGLCALLTIPFVCLMLLDARLSQTAAFQNERPFPKLTGTTCSPPSLSLLEDRQLDNHQPDLTITPISRAGYTFPFNFNLVQIFSDMIIEACVSVMSALPCRAIVHKPTFPQR